LVAAFGEHAVGDRTRETDGDESEIGTNDEFRAFDWLALLVNLAAFDAGQLAVLADELEGGDLEFTLRSFRLAGGGAHLGRPIGPDRQLVFPLRRTRTDVELCDAHRALTESGADAVGRGVAAANDHD